MSREPGFLAAATVVWLLALAVFSALLLCDAISPPVWLLPLPLLISLAITGRIVVLAWRGRRQN